MFIKCSIRTVVRWNNRPIGHSVRSDQKQASNVSFGDWGDGQVRGGGATKQAPELSPKKADRRGPCGDWHLSRERSNAAGAVGRGPPSLLGWMVLLSLREDSISSTQQLRSHRSKQPKWANPQRAAALFLLRLSLTLVASAWLMAPCAACALILGSGGSSKWKMVNKCALMGGTFIF